MSRDLPPGVKTAIVGPVTVEWSPEADRFTASRAGSDFLFGTMLSRSELLALRDAITAALARGPLPVIDPRQEACAPRGTPSFAATTRLTSCVNGSGTASASPKSTTCWPQRSNTSPEPLA